ncbi:MAG: amidohydrolase [Clostridiaceae bacterium]|nr:amidohydrolase [Clostridiaceae bacterium]
MFEKEILKKAKDINEQLIEIRRDIHAHPEIGLEEIRTSNLIADKLESLGIDTKRGVGKTGVVGLLKGKYEGKTILLRSDMDCLALEERNQLQYKSENKGLMHACGHDAHVAWLIGAAEILSEFKEELHGNIKFVFQPAEEISQGARLMIEDGVLEDPKVDAAIGAHVWPYIESGKIGVKAGAIMAATDHFQLTIYGKGGHGAHPHKCIDPILTATEIYMAFQTIISRRLNPLQPAVITVGKFNAGTAYNIIPDVAILEGTIRTISNETRSFIAVEMEKIIKGITTANGTDYKFDYEQYHPPVVNEKNMSTLVERAIVDMFGDETLLRVEEPAMTGEDFSYFQEQVPGVFFWVGIANKGCGSNVPLHASNFMVDEDVIHKASALFAKCALDFLNKKY